MAISDNINDRDKKAYKENAIDSGLDRRVTDVATQAKLDEVITAVGDIADGISVSISNEVEVKNDAGNPIPVSDAGGSLTVDGTIAATQSGIWNVADISGTISLPTGAATAALQTQPGVDIGDVTINNGGGEGAVPIQDGGNSITVDGSVTVTQGTGTNLHTVVDSGSITVANAAGASAVNIQDGGNSITVDGTVALSGTSSVNVAQIAGTATAVNAGNASAGTQRVVLATDQPVIPVSDNGGSITVDGSVTVTQATGTNLHTVIDSGTVTTVGTVTTITNVVHVDDNAGSLTVDNGGTFAVQAAQSGTWTVQPGNTANTTPWLTTISQGGFTATVRDLAANDALNVAIVDGSGNQVTTFGGGTQYDEDTAHASGDKLTMAGVVQQTADSALSGDGDRSVLQVDNSGWLKVNVKAGSLPTGAATAALQTQPGVDIGDVTINNAAGASAVNIQDGGNSITVDGSVTANAGTNLNTSALNLEATQSTVSTRIGDVVEAAPASDTASSGLNGRLQRIAQRLTSIFTTQSDGTQKSINRGGAKGATTAADITSTHQSVDRQGIDTQIRTSAGVAVDTFVAEQHTANLGADLFVSGTSKGIMTLGQTVIGADPLITTTNTFNPISLNNANQVNLNMQGKTYSVAGSGPAGTVFGSTTMPTNGMTSVVFTVTGNWLNGGGGTGGIEVQFSTDDINFVSSLTIYDTNTGNQVSKALDNGTYVVDLTCGSLGSDLPVRAIRFAVASQPISGTAIIIANSYPHSPIVYQHFKAQRVTYRAATVSFAPGTTPTDVFTIYGSGISGSSSKGTRVLQMGFSTTQTTSGINTWYIIKRSNQNTGGVTVANTAVPCDFSSAAAGAAVTHYTTRPTTLGAAVGTVWSGKIQSSAPASLGTPYTVINFESEMGQPIVLRNNTQGLCLNFNGAALPAGMVINAWVVWTEEL